MTLWVFIAVLLGALVIGYVLGIASSVALGQRAGGKPWWYDVAFPSPDETTVGAMKVLSDRYALGEIGAEEFAERLGALREVSETPEQRKQRFEQAAKAERRGKPA